MTPPRIALVTCAKLPDLPPDEHLLVRELRARGADGQAVIWDDPDIAWGGFDRVVVRSTWDYHHRLPEFLHWVDALQSARVPLWNPPALLRWNADKTYLRDLERRGVRVAPTRFVEPGSAGALAVIMDEAGWDDVVVKPSVSATAFETWRVTRSEAAAHQPRFRGLLDRRRMMVQPCLPGLARDGEWSLCFVGGAFSHAVLKRPAAGDFRVQHEFGGSAELVPRADELLVAAARRVADAAPGPWLYTRVDGCLVDGAFVLLELEMLEPSLFLDLDPGAAGRFADAILRR